MRPLIASELQTADICIVLLLEGFSTGILQQKIAKEKIIEWINMTTNKKIWFDFD